MKTAGFRIIKAALAGIMAGLFLLACTFIPVGIKNTIAAGEAARKQKNLIAACGEAFSQYICENVIIDILPDEESVKNATVSPDGQRWYMAENGQIELSLVPGDYRFQALCENRIVFAWNNIASGSNEIIYLDINKAPEAPELLLLEAENYGKSVFMLDIKGADEVAIDIAPDGIRIIRQGGGFALEVEAGLLPYYFYSLSLRCENESGYAITHIGISLRREGSAIPIYTIEDLDGVRNNLPGSFVLMNDIDMADIDDWKPIGSFEYPFTGVFDGGGYEITGLHAPDSIAEGMDFGLFDSVKNAEIRNIIIREPHITPINIAESSHCSALIADSVQSLIENCAVIGGIVAPADGGASGLMCSSYDNIFLGLFNSADVFCKANNNKLKNTGGITGIMDGYGIYLANEGEIYGSHLSGGIAGYQSQSFLGKCINSGYVWGSTLVGEFPPGGIVQTCNESILRDSYFVVGESALGGKAFNRGALGPLYPIEREALRSPSELTSLGEFGDADPKWAYAGLDASGPVPYGIFKRQAPYPDVRISDDGKLLLPPEDGLVYYYTLDGSDPRTSCPEGVDSVELSLPEGGVFKVFAAKKGYRDSETLTIAEEAVNK